MNQLGKERIEKIDDYNSSLYYENPSYIFTCYEENKMIEALSKMVELYEKQKESGLDFNEKDMILRKKQLAEIKYEKLKREHIESKESESWNEFEKNEEQEELEDEER